MLPSWSGVHVTLPSLAETLVTKYLRYIVGVSEDATNLQTVQLFEPILAAVSSSVMASSPQFHRDAVRALHHSATTGAIHISNVGQMVTSLILLFSFDKILGEQNSKPIKLKDFVSLLLPRALIQETVARTREDDECTDL